MEIWYKMAFVVFLAAVIAVVVEAARTLRQRPEGKVDQTDHELPALKMLRPLLGLVFYAALFDWLLPGSRLPWAALPLPAGFRWAGATIATGAVFLLRRSFIALGRNYRGGVGLWGDHELVVTGPYRWLRHPIYVAFVIAMAGIFALSANWVVGVSGTVLTLSIPALRLPVEESELAERFGDRYRDYAAGTARFVPGIF